MPPEHEYNREELTERAERESRALLGMSWQEAQQMLKKGSLMGTAVEAELRMLMFLMDA